MKKITYLVALSLVALVGCKKEFLERNPETSVSENEFWKTSNNLRLYSNNWYSYFPTYTGFGTIGIYGLDADDGSDNMQTMTYNTTLNGERVTPASGGGWNWGSIRNVNYFLANYTKSKESFSAISPYLGEAYFFRSLFYFDLLKQFGDLPWINKPLTTTSPELNDTRLSRSIIVDSLMNDLDKAVAYLPTKSSAGASRVNKQIAQLLQARIALYEGTWEKYHQGTPFGVTGSNGERFLKKAVEVSNNLLENNGGYEIETFTPNASNNNMPYWALFNRVNYSNSSEIMLWKQFDNSQISGHNWNRYLLSGAGRGLTKDLVDAYLCTDGNSISSSPLYKGDKTLVNVATNRDPRLAQTMYVNDGNHFTTDGNSIIPFKVPTFDFDNASKPATGYQVYKGFTPEVIQQNPNQGTNAVIYFRFAEALLINAEAKTELGTVTQSDLDKTVNRLRSRVGMPNLSIAKLPEELKREFPSLSPIINEIRRERRIEFACEGYRRDDLQRWAAMGIKIKGSKPTGAYLDQWKSNFSESVLSAYPVNSEGYIQLFKNIPVLQNGYNFKTERDYLSPLPSDQILLNPNLKQNPGW